MYTPWNGQPCKLDAIKLAVYVLWTIEMVEGSTPPLCTKIKTLMQVRILPPPPNERKKVLLKKLDFQKHLAARIKNFRLEKGLSQMKLSEMSGVCRSGISQAEGSIFMPSVYTAYRLAAAFEITVDKLIGEITRGDSKCN